VHFNLAENRSDEEAPFAFIATYTTRLSAQSRAQHLPLAEALHTLFNESDECCLIGNATTQQIDIHRRPRPWHAPYPKH